MSNKENKNLVIRPANLPEKAKALIQLATPTEFIKTRPGKGGKSFTYIEGGYVIARLNEVFSPVGWEFDVISEQIEQTEVIVRGKLTIKDHANGYTISKSQYGTHPRVANVPLGDTLKAATTDALKKCASMIGVGLDVYWQNDYLEGKDEDKKAPKEKPVAKPHPDDLLKKSLEKIDGENDPTILCQFKERINESALYTQAQKLLLIRAIDNKLVTYK